MSIRFLRSSSLSCGASGRGGVLGIELISDTIFKLNTTYVATSDDNFIPLCVLTQAHWTVVLDLGDWGLWGDCSCRVAARVLPGASRASLCTYPFVDWLVCRVYSSVVDEYTALVKSGQVQSYRGTGVWLVELGRPMWRRVSCKQQSDIVRDLLRKFERFRHAVVEPSCHGVLRSLARFRALERVGVVFVVFLPQL